MGRRVLVAEELGAGLGHITRLLPLARYLKAAGWTPIVASHQPSKVQKLAPDLTVVPGPPFPGFEFERRDAAGGVLYPSILTDVWGAIGMCDADWMSARMRMWDDMLTALSIDAAVFDYAPALAATVYERIPAVLVGDGYMLPPRSEAGTGFLRSPHGKAPLFTDEELLAPITAARAARGWSPVRSLADLHDWPFQLFCCPPQLDPYATLRVDALYVAMGNMAGLRPRGRAPKTPANFFAYLYHAPDVEEPIIAALEGIASAGVPGTLVFPELDDEVAEQLRDHGLTVSSRPLPFEDHLPQASVIVHYGGLGTATAAAWAGRPQLILPRHFENECNGRLLEQLGVARVAWLDGSLTSDDVADALVALVNDADAAERALDLSAKLAAMNLPEPGPEVLQYLSFRLEQQAA